MHDKCDGLGCTKQAKYTLSWPDAQLSMIVCADHLVAFTTSTVKVTTAATPPWSKGETAQRVLDSMVVTAEAFLISKDIRKANSAMEIAAVHMRSCEKLGVHLDGRNYECARDRLYQANREREVLVQVSE